MLSRFMKLCSALSVTCEQNGGQTNGEHDGHIFATSRFECTKAHVGKPSCQLLLLCSSRTPLHPNPWYMLIEGRVIIYIGYIIGWFHGFYIGTATNLPLWAQYRSAAGAALCPPPPLLAHHLHSLMQSHEWSFQVFSCLFLRDYV
jgi:hypothetical protein